MSRLRLAVLASHPIQYQAPLYAALAREIELKVFFCWTFGIEETHDPGFGRKIQWDIPLLEGYDHEFIPNVSRDPGTHRFFGLNNPSVVDRVLEWKPDAVVLHGYTHFSSLKLLAGCNRRGVPVLMRGESNLLHLPSFPRRLAKNIFLTDLMKRISAAVAIGSLNRDFYVHFGLPAHRIFLAPYSVSNQHFQARGAEARARARQWRLELDILPEQKVVLFAAKLIPVKGCENLIRAFASLTRDDAVLVVVGDGQLRGELEKLAQRVNVRFVGFVNQKDMPAAYALADVFVLPSHREPWGLAINEAMNMSLPIIVSDSVGAAPDLVSPSNGWVFPTGDVDALKRVLNNALNDQKLSDKGQASLQRINQWGIPETTAGFIAAARYATDLSRR